LEIKSMPHICWKTTQYAGWTILLLFCGALAPTIASAGVLRVVLLADVQVQGDAILLANLLPPDAPRAISDAAGKITLGSAPQNGTPRQFSNDAIIAAIQDAGLRPASFVVPLTVTVHRTARPVTLLDIWPAIQSFLEKHPVHALRNLQPSDLTLTASVAISGNNNRLAVTRLTFDAALHRANFCLRIQNVPGAQRFEVTARISSSPAGRARRGFQQASTSGDAPDSSASGMVLVDPRQSAHLRLHSPDSEMLLAVQPLQRGHLGETIRVRLRPCGKTLQARVVGQNALDAVF
jgi:hypothetical protein